MEIPPIGKSEPIYDQNKPQPELVQKVLLRGIDFKDILEQIVKGDAPISTISTMNKYKALTYNSQAEQKVPSDPIAKVQDLMQKREGIKAYSLKI